MKEYEAGKKAENICRELGISRNTFFNGKKRYSGMDVQHMRRLMELEEANRRLKSMYAKLALDNKILKDVIEKKLESPATEKNLPVAFMRSPGSASAGRAISCA